MSQENNVIIIGAGASGIAMGCQLQRLLNFTNFKIYEKDDDFGGTWYVNTYPGCICDIPSHFYSFSFEKNPDWNYGCSPQSEIQQYMINVSNKYNLPAHTHFSTECLGAEWDMTTERWIVKFKDLRTQQIYSRTCKFLVISAAGLSVPNPCSVPGIETFKGKAWHSARWNHQVDLTDKDIIVIGNGCSAAQFVPVILPKVKTLTQFIRSQHWIFYRPNWKYSSKFKWIMRYVPGAINLYRLYWAILFDLNWKMFKTKSGQQIRTLLSEKARNYIESTAPKKYHDLLIPKFEVGAKRRIFDADYLTCLNDPKILLTNDPLVEIKENAVLTKSGKQYPADIIIYANGFQVHEFLVPMLIKGKSGEDLRFRWKRQGGPRAYMGMMVSDFPNMFTIVGPNTASGHYSVIFMIECNVNFAIKLMKPLLKVSSQTSIEVTEEAEKRDVDWVQNQLKECIWNSAGESGFFIDKNTGYNDILYPHYQSHYWLRTLRPIWSDFNIHGTKKPCSFRFNEFLLILALICIIISWLIIVIQKI